MAALAFPVVLLLIIPKQVRSLAVFSAASNVLICSSILWVLVESAKQAMATDFAALKGLPLCKPEFPLFVGNSVYVNSTLLRPQPSHLSLSFSERR